jgi:hypothetical protein
VPIDSVGRAGGTEHAPAAVRERGLLERIGAGGRWTDRTCELPAGALGGRAA